MALAKKCDICNIFFDDENIENDLEVCNNVESSAHKGPWFTNPVDGVQLGHNSHILRRFYAKDTFDCCPVCIGEIRQFINYLIESHENEDKKDE